MGPYYETGRTGQRRMTEGNKALFARAWCDAHGFTLDYLTGANAGHNRTTFIYRDAAGHRHEAYALHRTVVVDYDCDARTVDLDNGGWPTVTTRQRMNAALRAIGAPFAVYQDKKEQYVRRHGGTVDALQFDRDITLRI